MDWDLQKAISYYKTQGAPGDQTALIGLLREIQSSHGGSIPKYAVELTAQTYGVKDSLLLTLIKRIPSLRLQSVSCLELCAGVNCGKAAALANRAKALEKASANAFAVKFAPCMRLCGKGPNLRWNGTLYHRADEALLQRLLKESGIDFPVQP